MNELVLRWNKEVKVNNVFNLKSFDLAWTSTFENA